MKPFVKNQTKLTAKEEEIMRHFWSSGPMFVRELLRYYPHPKPHFNTLSTIVRGLEEKGFLTHKTFGNTHQYFWVISEDEYKAGALKSVVNAYFKSSYMGVVSSLIEQEEISLEELKRLIESVEKRSKRE